MARAKNAREYALDAIQKAYDKAREAIAQERATMIWWCEHIHGENHLLRSACILGVEEVEGRAKRFVFLAYITERLSIEATFLGIREFCKSQYKYQKMECGKCSQP